MVASKGFCNLIPVGNLCLVVANPALQWNVLRLAFSLMSRASRDGGAGRAFALSLLVVHTGNDVYYDFYSR